MNISGLRSSGVFHFHTRHNDVHLSTAFSQESFRASEDHVHVAAATPEKKRKTRKHSFGQHLFTLLRRADRVKSYATSRWGRNCLNSCRRFSTRHHYIQLLEVVGFAFETDTMIVGRFWLSLPTTTRRCATAGASGAALSCHA